MTLCAQEEDRNEPGKYDDAFRSLRAEIFTHSGGCCGRMQAPRSMGVPYLAAAALLTPMVCRIAQTGLRSTQWSTSLPS